MLRPLPSKSLNNMVLLQGVLEGHLEIGSFKVQKVPYIQESVHEFNLFISLTKLA